ncbi:MAG: 3-hydroxybutyryl-CoA dehydratase [Nocardioidaceae bacterium]|nr:3-hydroxybutyryl-CoA dehydratase [Nocardioidaceae bacterium]
MSTAPTYAQALELPLMVDKVVVDDQIDQNGHMNITYYFWGGSLAAWDLTKTTGATDTYIADRGFSFFTVGHHISYLSELRLGDRYTVHAGWVERTDKAAHVLTVVVDRERERIACLMECTFVHVSMETRRAASIPDDIAASIDEQVAAAPWLPAVATGLSLRPKKDGR